jgi:hypothetical protein
MKTFKELLIELRACKEACEWAADKTSEQVIAECHRGDWLLWLAKKLDVDFHLLTLAKGHCANTVRHLLKDERSIAAVDAAIAFGEGKITREDLTAAYAADATYADAAYAVAAYAADAAAADASDATYAAAAAAVYAAAAAAAAAYAAAAAAAYAAAAAAAAYAAAASDAAYAAAAYAKKNNQIQTADICRKYLTEAILEKVKEATK